jgi:hypothetical protein
MHPQRAYALKVTWEDKPVSRDKSFPFVVVRPIIPGALVTPAEQTLDTSTAEAEADFYVTPLARGRLRGARVEVLPAQGGRVDVPLSMKVVRQRLTKVLLLLTFLLPALVLYIVRYNRLEGEIARPKFTAAGPAGAGQRPDGQNPPGGANQPPRRGGQQGGSAPPQEVVRQVERIRGEPGELLTEEIKAIVPAIPYVRDPVAVGLGDAYQFLVTMDPGQGPGVYFHFWLGVVLLGLTGISWFLHLSMRGTKRSEPIPVPRAAPEKTVAPSPRSPPPDKDAPIVVQPIEE